MGLSLVVSLWCLGAASDAPRDESIYVVQERAYSKSQRFELTPAFFTSLNNKFVGHFGPAVSAAYHVRENFAVELTTSVPAVMKRFYSDLVYEVRDLGLTPELVDLKLMSYFATLSLQYSALYGKLDFADSLIDYDFYVSGGAGYVRTLETCQANRDGCGPNVGIGYGLRRPVDGGDADKIAGSLGVGARIFFADWLGLRVEVRDLVYADRVVAPNSVTSDVRNNVLWFLGASFLL